MLEPICGQANAPCNYLACVWGQVVGNTQTCIENALCITDRGLAVLPNASGFLKKDGLAIPCTHTADLTSKCQAKCFGVDAMEPGLVAVGTGRLNSMPDGTTTTE